MQQSDFSRPYVISWNLTYRCNLACDHCYIDAGAKKAQKLSIVGFDDRSELNTEQCYEVIDQIVDFAPESLVILTGGEPLLRKDILEITARAAEKKLWVVVGTNGVLVTENLAHTLKDKGVRGLALSLDSLDAKQHDEFRRVEGAFQNTVNGAKLLSKVGLSFIIQTTVGKHNVDCLEELADFAYSELGAKVWNLYFLVQTGRGQFVSDLTQADYQNVLKLLHKIQQKYHQKMVVNAKCAPHYITHLLDVDPKSPFLRTFSDGAGGCPAGTHYLGIRPNGDVTPCPYLPVFGGNLKNDSLGSIWQKSDLFNDIRGRNNLKDKCGSCECNQICGGCRARAYGVTGDLMAEDPLCSYELGSLDTSLVQLNKQRESKFDISQIQYGQKSDLELEWEPEAKERMGKIPLFVRGMVVKAVERKCQELGLTKVTVAQLDEIRSRMPTPKVFARFKGGNQ